MLCITRFPMCYEVDITCDTGLTFLEDLSVNKNFNADLCLPVMTLEWNVHYVQLKFNQKEP